MHGPLQNLSADTAGPLPQQTKQGNKYFTLLPGRLSKRRTVIPTKTKSSADAGANLVNSVTYLQKIVGKNLSRFQIDGAGELSKSIVKNLFDSQGTQITTSVANSPSMNGGSERAVRTLEEATSSAIKSSGLGTGYWDHALADAAEKKRHSSIFLERLARFSLPPRPPMPSPIPSHRHERPRPRPKPNKNFRQQVLPSPLPLLAQRLHIPRPQYPNRHSPTLRLVRIFSINPSAPPKSPNQSPHPSPQQTSRPPPLFHPTLRLYATPNFFPTPPNGTPYTTPALIATSPPARGLLFYKTVLTKTC